MPLAGARGTRGPPAPEARYVTVDTVPALRKLVARCREVGSIAVDTETVLDAGAPPVVTPHRANLVSISIGVVPGEAYYLPFAHRGTRAGQGDLDLGDAAPVTRRGWDSQSPPLLSEDVAPLRALLEDPAVKKTAQNAKYDLLVLRRAGVTLRGLDFDTMLASYVLDPGRRSHAIDVLALEFLGRRDDRLRRAVRQGKNADRRSTRSRSTRRGTTRAPTATWPCVCARVFEPRLERARARRAACARWRSRWSKCSPRWNGRASPIDLRVVRTRSRTRFARERGAVEQQIYEAAGRGVQHQLQPQAARDPVREARPAGQEEDGHRAVAPTRSVLQELADEGHALPPLLMEYRELASSRARTSTRCRRSSIRKTGRLHTSFNQTVASTGRLSSSRSEPAEHPDPAGTRAATFAAGSCRAAGGRCLAADYSQIELRLLAHLSRDPAFVAGVQGRRRHPPPDGGA